MGASSYRTPYYRDSWSRCDCCGLDVPSHKIRLTRKHGWQCTGYPGAGCYGSDSDWDTDDYTVRYPAGEGARWTPAPLTNTLTEGIASNELANNQFYIQDHFNPAVVYLVTMGSELTIDIVANYDPMTDDPAFIALGINARQECLVFATGGRLCLFCGPEFNNTTISDKSSPFNVANGFLTYTNPAGVVSEVASCYGDYLLYDRSFPDNIYRVIFDEVIEVVRADGPAVGGILLNDSYTFYIQDDTANYDNAPFADVRPWNPNFGQLYVDTSDPETPLVWIPA